MTKVKLYNGISFIGIREASNATGLSEASLRRFFDQGFISGYKTPAGQRMFNTKSIDTFRNVNSDGHSDAQETEVSRINIVYTRVSTKSQQDDLERQISFVRQFIEEKGLNSNNYTFISDIGSGINFNKKGFNRILDISMQGNIGEVIISNKDRLSRFGYDLIEKIISKGGGKITVIQDPRANSSEQELAEDLLSIVHIYSCRQMGKRSHRNSKTQRRQTNEEEQKESESNQND